LGADRVMKLAKRLQGLIAKAEANRGAARGEVRMAEDSHAAKAEGHAAPTQAADAKDPQVDVDALGREVLETVMREMEMRRERRLGEGEDSDVWW
jgi:hypothetical protein